MEHGSTNIVIYSMPANKDEKAAALRNPRDVTNITLGALRLAYALRIFLTLQNGFRDNPPCESLKLSVHKIELVRVSGRICSYCCLYTSRVLLERLIKALLARMLEYL